MIDRDEQNSVLRDCAGRFEKLGIAYMLTGSMAMVHYAMPRMTADIDLVIEIKIEDVEKIIGEFEPDYYVPHGAVRRSAYAKSMFNLLHQKSLIKIDCIARKENEYQKIAFARHKRVDYAGFEVWIISQEDLILSKLNWAKKTGSEMQLRDVTNLLHQDFDKDYLSVWANKLGIEDLLNKSLERLNDVG
jgi:predicted nucleotidyltransferase